MAEGMIVNMSWFDDIISSLLFSEFLAQPNITVS